MSAAVERAIAVIEGFGGDLAEHAHMLANALEDAGLLADGENETRVEYGVRYLRDIARAQINYMCREIATALGIDTDAPSGTVGSVRTLSRAADEWKTERDEARKALNELTRERNTWSRQMADLRDERDTALTKVDEYWRQRCRAENERNALVSDIGTVLDNAEAGFDPKGAHDEIRRILDAADATEGVSDGTAT